MTPEILSLSETASSITQGGSSTLVSIVSDPLGLCNLAGGQLTSESGALLGAFVPTTQGTYSLSISWADLNGAAPINFTGATTLTNRATFYNAEGFQASADISITLYCGSAAAPDAACAGQCVNLTAVDTCGSCAASCESAGGSVAQDAGCEAPNLCTWGASVPYTNPGDTCASECAGGGGSCLTAQIAPLYSPTPISETCTSSPTSVGSTIEVTTVVTSIDCVCGSAGGAYGKLQTGNCASTCARLFGSPPCEGTQVEVAGRAGQYLFDDTCGAPYIYGSGTVWDGLVTADLPVSEPVMSPVTEIGCQCEGPAP